MLNAARFAVYIAGALGGIAAILSVAGYGTYDAATNMFDPPPISLNVLAGAGSAVVSSLLASVAWLKGWRRK